MIAIACFDYAPAGEIAIEKLLIVVPEWYTRLLAIPKGPHPARMFDSTQGRSMLACGFRLCLGFAGLGLGALETLYPLTLITRSIEFTAGGEIMTRRVILLAVGLCLTGSGAAQAQEPMMSPPKILSVIREIEKPGKTTAHMDWESGYPRAFARANWPAHYVALSSVSGEPRVLFLHGYDSMAEWEKEGAAQDKNAQLSGEMQRLDPKDAEFLTETRRSVLTYMPELSYHAEVPVAGTHYFLIVAFRVKPGHDDHFAEIRKLAKAAHEKANLSDHYAVYHFTLGAPDGSYAFFIPMKSGADLDEFEAIHGKAYKEALGDDGQKKMEEFDREGLESSEAQFFVLNPKMSYPPKEWVDADPSFWAPKSAAKPTARSAAKKEPEKK
jgi:hypothetical protein